MSDKSIAEKLYLRPGNRFLLVNPPAGYVARMGELPEGCLLLSEASGQVDVIQAFIANRLELEDELPQLKQFIAPKGMIWITYHKGTSKLKTDINRDTINAYAQSLGMTGVAMISIDDDWSALRLKTTWPG
ncbi:MAG: hypothetical protein ACM3H7_04135 [Acidobacteriaceae bacterium]